VKKKMERAKRRGGGGGGKKNKRGWNRKIIRKNRRSSLPQPVLLFTE
jgi:hypothetical protein